MTIVLYISTGNASHNATVLKLSTCSGSREPVNYFPSKTWDYLLELTTQFDDNAEYAIGRHKIVGSIWIYFRKANQLIPIKNVRTHLKYTISKFKENCIDSVVQQIHFLEGSKQPTIGSCSRHTHSIPHASTRLFSTLYFHLRVSVPSGFPTKSLCEFNPLHSIYPAHVNLLEFVIVDQEIINMQFYTPSLLRASILVMHSR